MGTMSGSRVLHVLEALEGGTARYVIDIVRHTNAFDHHVAIPSRRIGGSTDEAATGMLQDAAATVHTVEMRRSPTRPRNIIALGELHRLVRRLRPSIVHGHSSVGGALGRLAALHSPAARVYTPQGVATSRAALLIERALGRVTDRLVAASPSEADLVLGRRLVRPANLVMIPNGIDLTGPATDVRLRERLRVPDDAPLVGTIARLVPQKAPEQFVQACGLVRATCSNAHFVLIGTGPLEKLVSSEVAALGLQDCFHHVPVLANAAAVLDQLDVFALSSRFEGAPYAPLEAMRAGTPVVLTDVVGSRDAVEDGVSGVLVPPNAPNLLAAAINELVYDPARRCSMAEAALQRVRRRFDVRAMGAALCEVYGGVVAEVGRARVASGEPMRAC